MAARRRESAPHAVAARHSARRSASPREPRRAAERATSRAAVRRGAPSRRRGVAAVLGRRRHTPQRGVAGAPRRGARHTPSGKISQIQC